MTQTITTDLGEMKPVHLEQSGHITYYHDLLQGSDEWFAARCGLLTASEMKRIITPAQLKAANNDDSRTHLYELLAQRLTKYVEPSYISDDMMRGMNDEMDAKLLYDKNYGRLETVGFVTNNEFGFTLGYSPDALIVGRKAGVECKSRRQKYQIQTIIDGAVPTEHILQVQTGITVAKLEWIDFISYSGGLPMITLKVWPDDKIKNAIIEAAGAFEEKLKAMLAAYNDRLASAEARLIPTERKIEQEIHV